MKAPDFDYVSPQTLKEALTLLDEGDGDAMPLAGGQSLMPMLNFRLATPDLLVDLNRLDELSGIADAGGMIVIGAMTRYADLEQSDLIANHAPLMAKALPFIAHPAIRNRGTIGGSVALADPAAEMPALLMTLDATVVVASLQGERSIAAGDFFLGLYDTALRPGEIVKAISIPKAAGIRRFAFDELTRRHGDYAMVGLAATADSINPLNELRLAFFGIADRAFRAIEAEEALNGHTADDEPATKLATEAVMALPFDGDVNASADTKRHLAGVLLKRVLQAL
ncbi:MAG: xanthine dehydrogenase family protein subunit M [Pseudomonadota bacterium]